LANAIMASASGAFCIVSRVCATVYYSFAHEIGHLQGARHDRYVDNTDYSPYTYNHGRTYPTARWRTIMAYNNVCTAQGVSCTRINWWSNPGINCSGVATGISGGAGVGADNHLCLNNTAYTVANFRDSGGGYYYLLLFFHR
jgi:peptidyl-Asp metalloendopeptidase